MVTSVSKIRTINNANHPNILKKALSKLICLVEIKPPRMDKYKNLCYYHVGGRILPLSIKNNCCYCDTTSVPKSPENYFTSIKKCLSKHVNSLRNIPRPKFNHLLHNGSTEVLFSDEYAIDIDEHSLYLYSDNSGRDENNEEGFMNKNETYRLNQPINDEKCYKNNALAEQYANFTKNSSNKFVNKEFINIASKLKFNIPFNQTKHTELYTLYKRNSENILTVSDRNLQKCIQEDTIYKFSNSYYTRPDFDVQSHLSRLKDKSNLHKIHIPNSNTSYIDDLIPEPSKNIHISHTTRKTRVPSANYDTLNNLRISVVNVLEKDSMYKIVYTKMGVQIYPFCNVCSIWKRPSITHCDKCKRCVHKFQKHVDIFSNCLGSRNLGYFYVFFFSTIVLSIFHVCICGKYLFYIIMYGKKILHTPDLHSMNILIIYTTFLLISSIFKILIGFYLLLSNSAAIKFIRTEPWKISSIRNKLSQNNPFYNPLNRVNTNYSSKNMKIKMQTDYPTVLPVFPRKMNNVLYQFSLRKLKFVGYNILYNLVIYKQKRYLFLMYL